MTTSPSHPPRETGEGPVRLQKLLARAGVASRRVVEEMIVAGRVRVNGEVAELGRRAMPGVDAVEVDGVLVGLAPDSVWYAINKPVGVVTTASDPLGRPTVVDIVPETPRVFPVGRLDADTEGLLLLTNDGDVAFRLTHPSFGIEKEYLAHVEGRPSRGTLRRLREGLHLDDGPTAPASAVAVEADLIKLTIHEGRNRQVRRMFEAVGHPVQRLVRTRVGPLRLQGIEPGGWRELSQSEVRAIEQAVVRRDDAP